MRALRCHPDTPAQDVSVAAHVARTAAGLEARFRWTGALERVRLPAPRPARFADGLWRHSCCEMFVARAQTAGYREFNFSPSGEWAAYCFSGYREGQASLDEPPRLSVHREGGALRLEAVVGDPGGALKVALAAVLEADDGTLSYWALAHAPGRPDFHHPAGFALELS